MCWACKAKRKRKRGYFVTERVLYDDDYRKPLLIFKRFIDENGHVRGKPIPLVCDVEHSKALFNPKPRYDPRCKTLNHWVCPFRVKWSRYKVKVKCKRKRRLSPELVYARALTQLPYAPNILDEEYRFVSSYCRDKASKVLVFRNRDNEVFAKPYEYRYSSSRVARVRKHFRDDVRPNIKRYRDFLFMTLTISFRGFTCQYDAYKSVRKRWNKLWTAIRKRFKRFKVKMIRSFEWQKNGMGIHVHALICGIRFINADWVRAVWGEPNKRSVQLKTVRNWKQAYNYILKYVLKDVSADDKGEGLSVSQVINLAVGARAYGISGSLQRSLGSVQHNSNAGSDQKWVFLGVMDLETYNSVSVRDLLSYFGCGPP